MATPDTECRLSSFRPCNGQSVLYVCITGLSLLCITGVLHTIKVGRVWTWMTQHLNLFTPYELHRYCSALHPRIRPRSLCDVVSRWWRVCNSVTYLRRIAFTRPISSGKRVSCTCIGVWRCLRQDTGQRDAEKRDKDIEETRRNK